jgi:hypothetical protein
MNKKLIPLLLLMVFLPFFGQARPSDKSIDSILEVYEKTASIYIDNKIRNSIHSPQPEIAKEEAILMKKGIESTIVSINQETRKKFKDELQNVSNLQAVKDFIEYRYRVYIGGLTDEFYKKVSAEIDKL